MRNLVRSDLALAEISAALEYLEQRSLPAAERLSAKVDAQSQLLLTIPFMGRARDELAPGLRSVIVGDYLLFYCVSDTAVEIVRFLHGRSKSTRLNSSHERRSRMPSSA